MFEGFPIFLTLSWEPIDSLDLLVPVKESRIYDGEKDNQKSDANNDANSGENQWLFVFSIGSKDTGWNGAEQTTSEEC